MTGIGLNSEDYGGTFSWTMGFSAIMWVCAIASLLTIPFSWYCIQEVKGERAQMSGFKFLYNIFQERVIYRYAAYRFFYNVCSQITVTASSVIQSDWAKVEPLNSGIASMLTAILTMGGVFVIKKQVPAAAGDYVTQLFMIEIENQKGFEATLLGLGVTTQSVGTPFATVITKSIDGYFDIGRTFIEQDNHYVRSQVTYTYIIAWENLGMLTHIDTVPTVAEDWDHIASTASQ
ncbi:hypothetical protein PF011_g4131 [Phytophthora fragariae]|nr:hypothetical protein PF011_g4131 [Phytophthora fragariae]